MKKCDISFNSCLRMIRNMERENAFWQKELQVWVEKEKKIMEENQRDFKG